MHAEEREEMSKVRTSCNPQKAEQIFKRRKHTHTHSIIPSRQMIFTVNTEEKLLLQFKAATPLHAPLFRFLFIYFQGKHRDNTPYGEYGGWYKACKVNR